MAEIGVFDVSVSAFYDPKLEWRPGPGPRRLAARQERMRVEARCEARLPAGGVRILHEVFAPDGAKAAEGEDEQKESGAVCRLFVPDPVWWSPDSPRRYTLVSTLLCGENSALVSRPFGLRAVSYHPAWGFLLNGQPIALRGAELRALPGAKAQKESVRAQLQSVKAAGYNVIRVTAPGAELMELCDEMGLLMAAGLLSAGESASLPPAEAQTRAAGRIRAAISHPCVVMWYAEGKDGAWLSDLAQRHDPAAHAVCLPSVPFQQEEREKLPPAPRDAFEVTGFFSYAPDEGGGAFGLNEA